ncbi:hypothetical protein IWW38_003156 [Coemansia aciculifera]|uniref:Uncharacterized protein n=1 Tax=Coemansia aciculifera TaxID=417176 RepID=A0ACC1M1X7_9FUNG|nr:hypothetical protein IWW38_003156 [Coemansia aciculifera]
MDEDDCEASRRSRGSSGEGDMQQLAQRMLSMDIHDKSAEYYMIADLLKQIAELKRSSGMSKQAKDELAAAKLDAIAERRRADLAIDEKYELQEQLESTKRSLNYYIGEYDRLDTLSDRHRDHINSLNRNVEGKKEYIRELLQTIDAKTERIEEYESRNRYFY